VDGNNVSKFAARLKYTARKNETVWRIAKNTDPRGWSQHFPEIFVSSYRVRPPTQNNCKDRHVDPDPWIASVSHAAKPDEGPAQDATKGKTLASTDSRKRGDDLRCDCSAPVDEGLGQPWNGYLFEHSQLCMQALPVISGRNILGIEFNVEATDKTGTDGHVKTTFCMHEPLTCAVLWFLSAGGPDVDRSPVDVPLPSQTEGVSTVIKDGMVTTAVGKYCRFPDDVYFSEELNALALPLWMAALTYGLVQSAAL
jgi:hypothetical protein